MATVDDQATEREEKDREQALKYRRPTGPVPCGVCYYCNAEVPEGRRWCDELCFQDWEFEANMRHKGLL